MSEMCESRLKNGMARVSISVIVGSRGPEESRKRGLTQKRKETDIRFFDDPGMVGWLVELQ